MFRFIRKYHKVFIIACIIVIWWKLNQQPFVPINVPAIILLWLAAAYTIIPEFFKKHRIAIFSVYSFAFIYFLVFRLSPNYMEEHHINFVNLVVIPFPIFGAVWIYEQWRLMKTLKNDKMKTELALLKSQVNPHFFFNTLNNLYGLVVEKSEMAPEVVLKLSDMMRYTIYKGKEDAVDLSDEIEYLENYIELHKIRFQKKVDIKFEHEVDRETKIAPLLFIILLENAFKHGAEKMIANAYIHLSLKAQNDEVSFSIKNNYDPNDVHQTTGIGLDNLKRRLAHLYPSRYELKTEMTDSTYSTHLKLDL